MKSVMNCVQHATRVIPMTVTYSAGTPSIDEGTAHASVADTGTGIATLTFTNGFARAPVIVATAVSSTGAGVMVIVRSVAADSFVLEMINEGGTNADANVHLLICGFDSADEA